ncbi:MULTISPECIES: c-type cytochrome [unclassified Xanthobacter]|uniref:c-type cytochrome n=1 Tax=unclassified Xanthobacter TaxID=2623496 RepID=UPI001EDED094|nr:MULTISPECIES: cytochrome c [unclassified Xanthobacter]
MRVPLIAAALVGVLAATAATAQTNVIQQRRAAMKAIGEQTDIGASMLKGQVPFDAAKAELIFATYKDKMVGFDKLFPPGSDKGETKATAAVWSDRAGFDAAIAKFEKAVADNAGKATTADGFKAAFTAVAENCRACHQSFKSR